MKRNLEQQAAAHLHKLCVEIPERVVGSSGNRTATDYVAGQLQQFGFAVTCDEFACMDWSHGDVRLTMDDGTEFPAQISPYALAADVRGTLVAASTLEELVALDANGTLLLLRDDLTREQLMPKNFTFYNPEHHQQLIALLEAKQPAAILAATDRDPGLAGGISPFPLIEDGDFDIPSCYMTDAEGEALAAHVGRRLHLLMEATRAPASGCNVIGRKGASVERMVFCAHVDAKENTPGALDNASGVIVVLLLAELLQDYQRNAGLELLVFNGEDYYSAPGEIDYVNKNQGRFEEVTLAVNMDGAGYREGPTAFSFYGCPPALEAGLRQAFAGQPGIEEGPAWYQSDHSVFIQQDRPAVALTSAVFLYEITVHITHTPKDRPELVAVEKLTALARALAEFIDQATA